MLFDHLHLFAFICIYLHLCAPFVSALLFIFTHFIFDVFIGIPFMIHVASTNAAVSPMGFFGGAAHCQG